MPNNDGTRCSALTKAGKPCRAPATEGGLCFFHANPKKAVEFGRIGGRKKKRVVPPGNFEPLPKLETATAVRDLVGRLVNEVYTGRLNPRIAAGLAPLLNLELRAVEITDTEREFAELDKRLTELEAEQQKPKSKGA